MKRTTTPVANSTLATQALIERVLSKYDLPAPIKCYFFNFGVNDTYKVHAKSSTYYLRVYRYKWRTKAEILAELDMLLHLHKNAIPVSYPMARKNGTYVTQITAPEGVRYAVLFTEAPGSPAHMNVKQSHAYGELVSRVHACLDQKPNDKRRFHLDLAHLLDTPLQSVEPFLKHRPKDFDYLQNISNELKPRIEGILPKTKPEYGNCHGDHHSYNINIDSDGRMTLYDFDCYGYGWRAYDISVFLWNKAHDWSTKGKQSRTRRWNAFLEGYSKIRTLSQQELDATRLFVPIRAIWLLGLHTQKPDVYGRSWLHGEYFDSALNYIKRWIKYYKLL